MAQYLLRKEYDLVNLIFLYISYFVTMYENVYSFCDCMIYLAD